MGIVADHAVDGGAGALRRVATRGDERTRSGDVELRLRRCRADTDIAVARDAEEGRRTAIADISISGFNVEDDLARSERGAVGGAVPFLSGNRDCGGGGCSARSVCADQTQRELVGDAAAGETLYNEPALVGIGAGVHPVPELADGVGGRYIAERV